MGEFKLTSEIIALSVAKTWDRAKLEWDLDSVYMATEPETCLCGKHPIINACVLTNRINGVSAIVGNCCVKRMEMPSNKIFDAVTRISKDETKSLNAEALQHALQKGWITGKDFDFYLDIMRRQAATLKPKQTKWKIDINRKVLRSIPKSRP